MNWGGFFCFVLILVLVFRLPLKLQGLEAGRRLQELVDQWSDSVWQVLRSYNKGEITAYHFVCTQIQGHMHSLSFKGSEFSSIKKYLIKIKFYTKSRKVWKIQEQ